ncbi:MAG: nucleotidyltransferase family protein [Pseudomonadota bacterium]|nr:nucleotidyltransferase family protein [Pseudomonadota bacterium]
MKDQIESMLIGPGATLMDAARAIDAGGRQIAMVVDADRRLLATVTDGDIRRGLLRGFGLDAPVEKVMKANPTFVTAREGREAALRMMRRNHVHQVPVVDDAGRVVALEWLDDVLGLARRETWVVLMAGGLGVRLRPLTEDLPKPMLPVGGRPLLESIIRNFSAQGYRRFFVSVNYRRDIVQQHFGDGSDLDVQIEYLVEDRPLGTAGALSLLPARPPGPMVVMNGDLLTAMQFDSLVRFHEDHGSEATLCAREYTMQVPYGVVNVDGPNLTGIVEKPVHSHFVNAGIYALSPSALDLIPRDSPMDMPQLFNALLQRGRKATVFPVREYWIDIGRIDDLERARSEFDAVFGND